MAPSDKGRARTALDIHPDAIVLARYDPEAAELRIVDFNPAMEHIIGRTAGVLQGAPMRELLADQTPFEGRDQRKRFFDEVRARQSLEFPGLSQIRDQSGKRRSLRVRLHWPKGTEYALAIAEDVTERSAAHERQSASERLRSAIEISGLLSHHVNNALTSALMGLELLRNEVGDCESPQLDDVFSIVSTSMHVAVQVVAALAATTEAGTDVRESSDLVRTLQVVASLNDLRVNLRPTECDAPCHVWGARSHLEMILKGILPLLGGEDRELEVSLGRDGADTVLSVRSAVKDSQWLSALVDPSEPLGATDQGAVRLFSSVQVLRAIGGQLGLPRIQDGRLTVNLRFRTAPGLVEARPRRAPVLLVSGDGALRALLETHLEDRDVSYTDSLREGIVRLLRPGGGFVLCDASELEVPLPELLALASLVNANKNGRLILLTRAPSSEPLPIPELPLPFDKSTLDALLDAGEHKKNIR